MRSRTLILAMVVCLPAVAQVQAQGNEAFLTGWSALETGQTDRAVAGFERGRPLAANHPPTLRVMKALDSLKAPCPLPDLTHVLAALRPLKFARVESAHVILLHQGAEAEASERLGVLEQVVTTFSLWIAAQGVVLPPPGQKLVSVYFAEGRDYSAFLGRVDASVFSTTQGYYHPNLHTVFAFDTRSSPAHRAALRAVANRARDGGGQERRTQQARQLEIDWRGVDLGIAAHETVHQLIDACGLAPHFDDFPLWLHEGLATQFEVVRDGQWAGVGRVHDSRLPDWRSIQPEPSLGPLIQDAGLGQGYRREAYAQSWALVYFLRKTKPTEFLTFLDLLRTPALESTRRSQKSVEAFDQAFGGDRVALERSWRLFMAGLDLPSESRLARPASRP